MPALAGLTALVESGPVEATGVVSELQEGTVTVICDGDPWEGTEMASVQVSVFAPDALYRLTGAARVSGSEVTVGPGCAYERIQRRQWPRRRLDLPATVCPLEAGHRLAGVPARTVDVGLGGVSVETLRPLDGEDNPMLILNLPDGTTIVTLTTTVAAEDLGDGWRYRLAFKDLDSHDRYRLAGVVED